MGTNFDERQAVYMTLQSLLDLRTTLRREYVDRDKELAQEIKQLLHRIRELDERHGVPVSIAEEKPDHLPSISEEVAFKPPVKDRRTYQHYNYQAIARELESVLSEAQAPLTLTELYEGLQKRQKRDWSTSPYIVFQKALKHTNQIQTQKEGRKLLFSLRGDQA